MTHAMGRHAFGELAGAGLAPASLEQHKLERLLELRAVITSMRLERSQELMFDALTNARQGHGS